MRYIILFFFCFNSLLTFSQKNSDFGLFGLSYVYTDVVFRNGEEKTGLGKLNLENVFVFKESEDAEKQKYTYRDVKSFTFHLSDGKKKYVYKIVRDKKGKNKILPLIESVKGKLNLYYSIKKYSSFSSANVGGNIQAQTGTDFYSKVHYLGKENEDTVKPFGLIKIKSKSSKKIAKDYFSDCPELVEKISNDYFENLEIEDVVNYYNANCK